MRHEETKRVGVLFRLDTWAPLMEGLTDAQAGRLFRASLVYADTGATTRFPDDEELARVWAVQKSAMDRDAARFRAHMRRRNYEAYVHDAQKRKAPVVPFEDWKRLYGKGGGGNGGGYSDDGLS